MKKIIRLDEACRLDIEAAKKAARHTFGVCVAIDNYDSHYDAIYRRNWVSPAAFWKRYRKFAKPATSAYCSEPTLGRAMRADAWHEVKFVSKLTPAEHQEFLNAINN